MSFETDYLNQPYEVSLETFALCNATCTFCPYPTLERKGTKMSLDLMTNLALQMQDFEKPFIFSPFKVNEPFLDDRLISYLKNFNRLISRVSLRLFTNGSTLTEQTILEIGELENVLHLWISLNSVDAFEYKQIMNLSFINTASKLDRLHHLVAVNSFQHPVMLSMVSNNDLGKRIEFLAYCNSRWPLFGQHVIKQDSWLGYVAPSNPEVPDTPCGRWFELSIMATGVVALCCMDGKGEFPIGDVNKNSLLEIYNHPYWRERREKLPSRRLLHPCKTCSY